MALCKEDFLFIILNVGDFIFFGKKNTLLRLKKWDKTINRGVLVSIIYLKDLD